jgi:hypothetical protein
MDAMITTFLIVGSVVLVLGILFWLFVGLIILVGAATMVDVHDGFPSNEDFENYDRKRR